jgi:F0F1-type ATP synthase assembly protein I
MAGIFFWVEDEVSKAVASLCGGLAFFIGSVLKWYIVMEFC